MDEDEDHGGKYQFTHIKTIDVIEQLESHKSTLKSNAQTDEEHKFVNKLDTVYRDHFDHKKCKMSFNINDKMDITVKVMTKEDKKKKVKDKKAKNTDSLQLKDKAASLI
jgi:hypothetical protein